MTIFFAVLFTIAIGIIVHDNLYANAKEVTIRVDGLKEGKIVAYLKITCLRADTHRQAGKLGFSICYAKQSLVTSKTFSLNT